MYTYPILVGACTTIHSIWDLGDSGSACHILDAKSYLCSWNGPKLVGSFFSFTLIFMKLFGSLFTFNTIRYVLGDWCLGAGYSLQWVSSRARVHSSHQCTTWLFCSLVGCVFFICLQMGFITVHFFLLLITVFWCWFIYFFDHFFSGPDLTHSYPIHLPTFISTVPILVSY